MAGRVELLRNMETLMAADCHAPAVRMSVPADRVTEVQIPAVAAVAAVMAVVVLLSLNIFQHAIKVRLR